MEIASFYLHMYSNQVWWLYLREKCDIMFLIYHVITWLKVISPNGCMSFHPSHQIWLTCLFWNFDIIIKKIGNTKSGSLKNEIENSYYEVITKCDRSLLQSALDITKRDSYYKVRRNREAEIESCSSAKIELRYPETGSASKFNRKF